MTRLPYGAGLCGAVYLLRARRLIEYPNPAVKPAEINLKQTFDNSYVQKALAKYRK